MTGYSVAFNLGTPAGLLTKNTHPKLEDVITVITHWMEGKQGTPSQKVKREEYHTSGEELTTVQQLTTTQPHALWHGLLLSETRPQKGLAFKTEIVLRENSSQEELRCSIYTRCVSMHKDNTIAHPIGGPPGIVRTLIQTFGGYEIHPLSHQPIPIESGTIDQIAHFLLGTERKLPLVIINREMPTEKIGQRLLGLCHLYNNKVGQAELYTHFGTLTPLLRTARIYWSGPNGHNPHLSPRAPYTYDDNHTPRDASDESIIYQLYTLLLNHARVRRYTEEVTYENLFRIQEKPDYVILKPRIVGVNENR